MSDAHEQTEYKFQLIKGEQPNAMKCLTRREVLVEGLGRTLSKSANFEFRENCYPIS